ncbi:DNA polymerase III subunit gamma/tau [Agitococcus lubricus]|uniref:DNA polymerase III subunit gamma/tau n=1 Tax=Agitococcus lubricus TaxID=1077255 RepID=A0A2T5IWZ9_9GAMM|nr:DNA polymerase III subunit gamma/tau [Agitococcus lubricus]PTQ88445.1 DNA polymerase III subunit gamma/tau [Agitococcus lubricus]
MSYQVLARKYRPKNFAELVGQEHVARALSNALIQNRLHHAYLFTGTRGVGKTTIARILAKCLNCETGISAQPCGVCQSCQEINQGRYIDLIEIDAASNTGVDDVREVIENAQYMPSRGQYKVYLIDEVHMLSKAAFNALLKTLEEPPAHVKFLLATTDPQKIPVTVLSRCLQFALKPMSPERVVTHLQSVLQQETINFEMGALWELGRAANGSMRDALSLTDQAIAFGQGALLESEVRDMLGSIDRQLVYQVLTAIHTGDASHVLHVIQQLAEQSVDFQGALAALISYLHRIALAQLLPDAIDNSEGDKDHVLALADDISPEDIQLYYQIALHGRRDLPLAITPRQGFEMCLLRMLTFKPVPTKPTGLAKSQHSASAALAQVKASLPKASHAVPSASLAVRAQETQTVVSTVLANPVSVASVASLESDLPAPVTPTTTATILPFQPAPVPEVLWTPQRWYAWVMKSGLTGMVLTLAKHALLQGQQQGVAVLEVSPRYDVLVTQSYDTLKARVLQDFPKLELQLTLVEPVAETPLQIEERLLAELKQRAEQEFLADPTVKALIHTFNAHLVPDSLIVGDKR